MSRPSKATIWGSGTLKVAWTPGSPYKKSSITTRSTVGVSLGPEWVSARNDPNGFDQGVARFHDGPQEREGLVAGGRWHREDRGPAHGEEPDRRYVWEIHVREHGAEPRHPREDEASCARDRKNPQSVVGP